MVVKYFTTKFSELAEDNVMRCDEKFFSFFLKNHWILYPEAKKRTIQLRDILKWDYNVFNLEEDEEYKWIPTGWGYVDEDWEINDYQSVNLDNCPWRIKYTMTNDNIAISSLRLAKAPAIYFEDLDLSDYIFSNWYYIFKIKNNWNKKFVLYVLRVKAIKKLIDNNIYRWIWISAYREEDLLKIKIPDISIEQQNIAIEKIEPIEQRIKQLKATIKPVQEVIDDVFTRELWFNKSEFVELKKKLQFKTTIADFWGNRDLRDSCKFHRPSAYMLQQFLSWKTNLKIKHFLTEDIVLWAGVSPSDYDENGDYSYISMATIKNWDVNYEEAKSVSNDYSNLKIAKSIKKWDILIARSGEWTIWKVALVEEDYDWIFADFVMRVRLEGCNLKFVYYYFRSYIFQYLIEIHKKWLWNNTNIFPVQIREFPFPTISLSDQERIVEEIQTEIDKQDKIRKEIEQERNRIDEIIESVVRN